MHILIKGKCLRNGTQDYSDDSTIYFWIKGWIVDNPKVGYCRYKWWIINIKSLISKKIFFKWKRLNIPLLNIIYNDI